MRKHLLAFGLALAFPTDASAGEVYGPPEPKPFILPEPDPDPLVEIAREMALLDGVVRTDNQKAAIREGRAGSTASDDFYDRLRTALPARGYRIERIDND